MKKSILAIVFVVAIVLVGCSDFSHEHSWKEVSRVDATCTEDGKVVYVCIGCGDEDVKILEAIGHDVPSWTVVESESKIEGVCLVCGETVSRNVSLVRNEAELNASISDASKPIYIMNDISLTSTVEIKEGQVVEINLNGKTISAASMPFLVRHGNVSFVGVGVIQETKSNEYAAILIKGSETDVENYSVVTVGKDVTLKGWSGIFVDQLSSKQGKPQAYGVVVNMYGKVVVPSESSHDAGIGIYVNGNIKDDGNVPTFNIEGAHVVAKDVGIYAAGYAKWNIKDTTIEGVDSAIEIRAGEMNIDGGSFKSTATSYKCSPEGSGTTTSGAAIAVAQHTTKLPINVSIKNTTLEGVHRLAVENPQGNEYEDISKVRVVFDSSVVNPHISEHFEVKDNVITAKTISE